MFGWKVLPPHCYLGNLGLNIDQYQASQIPSSQIRKHICTSYQQSYGRHTDNAGKDARILFPPMERNSCLPTVQIFCERTGWQGSERHRHLRIDPRTQEVWYKAIVVYCTPTMYQAMG